MTFATLFLSPHGRIGRKPYWIGLIILLIAQVIALFLPVVGQIIGLLLIYPAVCVYGKRLHDLGRGMWWLGVVIAATVFALIAIFAVAVRPMLAVSGGPHDEIAMLNAFAAAPGVAPLLLITVAINLGFVLWLGVAPGQKGDNRFGPVSGGASLAEGPA